MTVIFDMDGVIFDSERLSKRCWRRTAKVFDIDEKTLEPAMMAITGTNVERARQIFNESFSHYPKYEYDKMRAVYEEAYRNAVDSGELQLKPGALEILSSLCGWCRVGLASSTNTEKVRRELKLMEIEHYFDVVIGGDQVTRSKPDPEIFLTCCERLGGTPEESFVVEDSYNGITAAAAAGMRALMVPDLLPPTKEMEALSEAILPDLFAALDYIRNNTDRKSKGHA